MARIIGGIGSSHAPSIGTAWDKGPQREDRWAPVFDGYLPAQHWVEAQQPDLLVIFYNDHMNRFFFDAYPTLALGVGEVHRQADEGWGKRNLPDLNVIQHPLPTARRLFRLGAAVRRAIEAWPQDKRVLVMGTGGLSHQLHGERYGFINQEWDNRFMDLLETEPETLAALPHQDWMERGGTEGVEMIIWLAMRAALGTQVRRVHRNYVAPMTTGLGLLALAPA
jgi:hypothetical protein